MVVGRLCCVLLLIVSGGVFASSSASQAIAGSLTFSNLKQTVLLQQRGEGYVLEQSGRILATRLSNRLVVKTHETMTAEQLKQIDTHVEKTQQLAQLKNANIWLLTLRDMDLQRTMKVLQEDRRVIYVQPDLLQARQLAQQQFLEATVAMGGRLTLEAESPRRSVRLAIIDDGFNFNHPEFAETNLVFEYDADQRVKDASPKSELDQHGTLVAGVIVAASDQKGIDGLAPDIELIAIRQVSSWTSDMVIAFSVARMMQADVVNSSWVLSFLPEPLFDLLDDWWQERQPYLVFSAGNNNLDACQENAFSQLNNVWMIGASDGAGQRLPFSNHGACVSVYAAAQFMSTDATGTGYKKFGGTSAAAAYVSGLLARELFDGRKPDLISVKRMLQLSELK